MTLPTKHQRLFGYRGARAVGVTLPNKHARLFLIIRMLGAEVTFPTKHLVLVCLALSENISLFCSLALPSREWKSQSVCL